MTDPMVLVGGDRHELGLGEDEGPEVLRSGHVFRLRVDVDDVKARLIAVHRVEDDLRTTRRHLVKSQNDAILVRHNYTQRNQTRYQNARDVDRVGFGVTD